MYKSEKNSLILNTIYEEVFKRLTSSIIDVFLCGGVSTKYKISARDELKKGLEESGDVRVLYPEDLFMDLLNTNKNYNLLSLEKVLADNCDKICIVCESVGSFVELGAFTNNSDTFDKVIAMVQTKFKHENSFLMKGPIEYIQTSNKKNVIFYNTRLEDAKKELENVLRPLKYQNIDKDIDTIIGMHDLLLLVFYFFRELDKKTVIKLVKGLLYNKGFTNNFYLLYNPAMKLLYNDGLIEEKTVNKVQFHSITKIGIRNVEKSFSKRAFKKKHKIIDGIRLNILYNEYY